MCVADESTPSTSLPNVARAFRSLSWPASQLLIQPVGGKTLVNFETNFRTDNIRPHTRHVRLLGYRVTIEATPVEYIWHFEPGATRTTTIPGAKYPDLQITHDYQTTGTHRPSLDTVYQGRYRINGGTWQPIGPTLTVPGSPIPIEAIEARPVLVD